MNLQDQLPRLALAAPQTPEQPLPTMEAALEAAEVAPASMVAVWSVTADGQLEYSCFRKDFPVTELRKAIEQFGNDQLAEEFRCRVRDVIHEDGE